MRVGLSVRYLQPALAGTATFSRLNKSLHFSAGWFREIQAKAQMSGVGIWSIENYAQEDGFNVAAADKTNAEKNSTKKTESSIEHLVILRSPHKTEKSYASNATEKEQVAVAPAPK